MFEKLGRDVFVNVIFAREFNRNPHQVQRKHSHPTRAIALFKMATVEKGGAAIEYADVIESEESALKDIVTFGIFSIHPPGKGEQQFMEDRIQECAVAFAGLFALDLENAPGCPCQDGRIYVAKVPFIGGNLAVRVLIPFTDHSIELAFGKVRVDQSQWNAMKSQIPRGVPWKFPTIGHRHDALIVKMAPIGITTAPARVWRRRLT